MAHNLTYFNGRYEFAYSGEAPWHGLGQKLQAVATSGDIIKAAGLEWSVIGEPIYLASSEELVPVPGYRANVRSDTREVLGVVSDDYKLFQNGDAFGFLDALVKDASAIYETAGSIRRGRKVFAAAKLPESLVVVPDDVVNQYLLLVNNHDGEGGLHLRWTPIRVVCNNTLTAALHGAPKYEFSVRHVGDLSGQVRQAANALGLAHRYFNVAGQTYRALSAKQINAAMLDTFLSGFVPVPHVDATSTETAIAERERALETHARIRVLFETGLGTNIPGVRGTAWGAFNAGVEWLERVRSTKQDGTLRKGAAEAIAFGVGQDYRQRALDSAVALLTS